MTVHEITLTVEDFRQADEIFSTGNMSKVVPVIGFDDTDAGVRADRQEGARALLGLGKS